MPDVPALLVGEPAHDQAVFETRVRRYWADLLSGLTGAYPGNAVEMAYRLVEIAMRRPPFLDSIVWALQSQRFNTQYGDLNAAGANGDAFQTTPLERRHLVVTDKIHEGAD